MKNRKIFQSFLLIIKIIFYKPDVIALILGIVTVGDSTFKLNIHADLFSIICLKFVITFPCTKSILNASIIMKAEVSYLDL